MLVSVHYPKITHIETRNHFLRRVSHVIIFLTMQIIRHILFLDKRIQSEQSSNYARHRR